MSISSLWEDNKTSSGYTSCSDDFKYTSYCSDVFEEFEAASSLLSDISQLSDDGKLFNCQPGSGLSSFFSFEMCPETLQPIRTDLFGGLTHSRTHQLNATLVLPSLPEYSEYHKVGINKEESLLPLPRGTSMSSDEGIGTTLSDDTVDVGQSASEERWAFIEIEPNWDQDKYWKQKTWENSITSERSYLTEAGTEAIDYVIQLHTLQLAELAHMPAPPTRLCNMNDVVNDTQNMLLGLPAHHYTTDKTSQSFHPVAGLKVAGCSPSALYRMMEQFAVAGTDYLRLNQFAAGQGDRGSVARSLGEFLNCFMHCYTAAVVSTQVCVHSLIQLRTVLHRHLMIIRLLAKMFSCNQYPDNIEKFPKGLALINTVYEHCLSARADPTYPLMLSLLRNCCKPYITYIQQWIYEGVCVDQEEEFGIILHDDILVLRDESYWTEGHTLSEQLGCCPSFFPRDLSPAVFTAGKSLRLLKLCNPKNRLCNVGQLATPPISITFDVEHLESTAQRCQEYETEVEEYMNEILRKHKEEELRIQEEKRKVLSEARTLAMAEEQRRQSEEQAVLLATEAKKKAWLAELKAHMEQDLELRAMKKQEERDQDVAWLKSVQEKEAALDEHDKKVLEAARQELVEHYEALMKEATLREQRAEWRTRRLQLSDARKRLWQAEREEVREEMEKLSSDELPTSPQAHSPDLSSGDQQGDHVIHSDIPMASDHLTIEPALSNVEELLEQEQNVTFEEPRPLVQEPHPLVQEPHPQPAKPLTVQDTVVTMETTVTETTNFGEVHVSESSIQYGTESGNISKPHVSDSVVQQVLNPTINNNMVMEEFSKHLSPRQQPRRGVAPPTTIQDILYPSNSPAPAYHSTRGKPPPTTIQNLLYHYDQSASPDQTDHTKQLEYNYPWLEDTVEPYTSNYDMLDLAPASWLTNTATSSEQSSENILPLSTILWRCIAVPLNTQARLVNTALVQYFTTELAIQEHFLTLKSFLLLEDGEFGHALTTSLFEELAHDTPAHRLCSSALLNPILVTSLESSVVAASCRHTSRLSFSLKYQPNNIRVNSVGALDFLELQYKVDWPCNIVITEQNLMKYNKVFEFLVELKRASWALKNVFYVLKKYQQKYNESAEMRQLQVFRHEMQQFISIMEGYIVNQVLYVSWQEFQKNLQDHVFSLDDLRDRHSEFIDKAVFRDFPFPDYVRCLLSKKAGPVMNIIKEIFTTIHKFHFQLTSSAWEGPISTAHTKMCETHKRFHQRAQFLFTVVTKLVQRGYQPHLEDFLLRLNFNLFYKL